MGAANDNAPAFTVTPGLDGLRLWRGGQVVAWGLTATLAAALLRRLNA